MSPIAKAFRTGIISVILAATAIAQPNFTVRHTAPGGGNVWDIVEGTSGMVAVGTNGTILHSIDGDTWMLNSVQRRRGWSPSPMPKIAMSPLGPPARS